MNPLLNNIIDCDSYKSSHAPWQYPPNTTGMYSYLESRGGRWGSTIFFGLQYLLKEHLSKPVTVADVEQARAFMAVHGVPFNEAGWLKIAQNGGHLPVKIRAVAEGQEVPTHNILLSVESTDPDSFWVVSWIETQIVRLWYPITVATQSFYIKRAILEALEQSANDPWGEIPFKLHDFGSRGVSSRESAGIGGMAHLVNFAGSDTLAGVMFANHYYHHPMAAFSIPASEHSTITMWGREREFLAYQNMVKQFCKPGKIVACVSDSYDLWNVLENIWGGDLRDEIKESGGTLVVRPDSGDPAEVVLKTLQILERKVGMSKNLKGYKVLPPYLRVIQGDGVNEDSIKEILNKLLSNGYSASNIAFGMGGALLQKLDRDTQKFAFKCSEATVDGKSVDVFKDPITDKGKRSKAGRLDLIREQGYLKTILQMSSRAPSELVTVFDNGTIVKEYDLETVRKTAEQGLR
jgi:nicotinamide phosphoribosyltransferase